MKRFTSIAVAALTTILIGGEAFAQRHHSSRSVTHSPSIHRGNYGQSAVRVRAPQQRVFPGTKIHVDNRSHYRPGHHNKHHGHNKHFAKRHHRHYHGPSCHFKAAHYVTQYLKVWVPGHYEKQYVPPRYEYRQYHGRTQKVCIANGYYTNVYIEGYYNSEPYRVWLPATWSCGFYY